MAAPKRKKSYTRIKIKKISSINRLKFNFNKLKLINNISL